LQQKLLLPLHFNVYASFLLASQKAFIVQKNAKGVKIEKSFLPNSP